MRQKEIRLPLDKSARNKVLDRFYSKFEHEPDTGCWLWKTGKGNNYPTFRLNRQAELAHRIAYVIWYGPFDQKLFIHHACRSKCCVNPLHLELVTPGEHARIHGLERRGKKCESTRNKMHSKDDPDPAYLAGLLEIAGLSPTQMS